MFSKLFGRAVKNLKITSNFSGNLNPNHTDGILLQHEIQNDIDDILLNQEINPSIVAVKQKDICDKVKLSNFHFQ